MRRQYYDNVRKASEELKKIEKVAKTLSVIHPRLRVTISHNKCLIWHKTAVSTLKQSLMQMYQHVVLKNLEYFSHSIDNVVLFISYSYFVCRRLITILNWCLQFSLEMLICKRDCNWSVLLQPLNEAILLYVNQRPIKDKKVEKVFRTLVPKRVVLIYLTTSTSFQVILEEMSYLFQSALPNNKCPLTLISLRLPSCDLDVNLEPDKTKVFIRNHVRQCTDL